MATLKIGDIAPSFNMPVASDRSIALADLKGKYVIMYFYPKDDTPGCTIEAQEFNKLKAEFTQNNAVIIGISKDDLNSHNDFQQKYCLEFDLASDADHNICEQYGVWGEKSMFGKKYMGINRSTYLIDPAGRIAYIWQNVKPEGHARAVLQILKEAESN